GVNVASIDYRIAPKYQYPAALEDAQKAWNWLLEQGYKEENIVVVGDSAGGNLALALVAILRDNGKPLPKAIICMSPWADMAGEGESYSYNLYNDPIFGLKKGETTTKKIETSGKIGLYAGDTDPHDKYLSPVYSDFNGFPSMLIQVGTFELIESDSIAVFEKATAAGVNVTLTRYKGMFHVFQLLGNITPEGQAAWEEVGAFLRSQFQ
ncbi:MAG: acetylhydrolase, partial [Clostridiales bacterium]|nr:acetylhydrolase [Clostridiales bacterium]